MASADPYGDRANGYGNALSTDVPYPSSTAGAHTAPGDVVSATFAKDDEVPDKLEPDDEDDEEDIVRMRKRTTGINGIEVEDKEEQFVDEEEDEGDDLFGDDPDEDETKEAPSGRKLDDEELDSGDDMGRNDRAASGTPAAEAEQEREELIQYSEFGRQPEPEPTDGEMYLLKVPDFLSIESSSFETPTFRVPEREHHSRQEPPPEFSAYSTAMSTVRWRHSPSDPTQLQSNARVLRWSDGSLTLQLASDPSQQYEIDGHPLAPTQRKPAKPTPVSSKPQSQETYTYLTVPHENVGLLRVTHKITAGLSILPSQKTADAALQRLQASLAAAVRGKNGSHSTGIEMIAVAEDPELGRKKAELAEREKQRAAKRREAAEARDRERGTRALGRAGLSSNRGYGGGLSASMLEDDERPAPRAKPKARRPRNDEYSSDEDLGRRRGNFANDDYEVDDFVAGSDEEEEAEEEDDDDEDIDDGIDLGRSNKRAAADDEDDAEGEDDDEDARAAQPKGKRRRAVVDEDDDE